MARYYAPVITRALILLLAGLAAPAGAEAAADPADDGERTLDGVYTSGFHNGPQRLRAEFRPTGEQRWEVAFHFRWSGEDRIYRGTAEGFLGEGLLEGRVRNEDQRRIFTFRCEFDRKKRCKGRHAEVVRTGEHETGTISLKERINRRRSAAPDGGPSAPRPGW